jgi:hypothetical protein
MKMRRRSLAVLCVLVAIGVLASTALANRRPPNLPHHTIGPAYISAAISAGAGPSQAATSKFADDLVRLGADYHF